MNVSLDYFFHDPQLDKPPIQVMRPVRHSYLIRNAFTLDEIKSYYQQLSRLPWMVQEITVAGKKYMPKRETLGFARSNNEDLLKNRSFYGIIYPKILEDLRAKVREIINDNINEIHQLPGMNYCWGNRYRNGEDKVGKHKDNEKYHSEVDPIISLSFGTKRHFDIYDEHGRIHREDLGLGDIFLMMPGFQDRYYHGVPVQKRVKQSRINLTFRTIHRPPEL